MRKNTLADCQARLKERVEAHGDCRLWLGGKNNKGYGSLNYDGKTDKAHRVAYLIANGAIPPGLHVLHRCDNRACVNPSHLFLGSNKDNIEDKVAKDRASKKLTQESALEIKGMVGTGTPQSVIAEMFGVTQSCVSRIASGARRPGLAGRV